MTLELSVGFRKEGHVGIVEFFCMVAFSQKRLRNVRSKRTAKLGDTKEGQERCLHLHLLLEPPEKSNGYVTKCNDV